MQGTGLYNSLFVALPRMRHYSRHPSRNVARFACRRTAGEIATAPSPMARVLGIIQLS